MRKSVGRLCAMFHQRFCQVLQEMVRKPYSPVLVIELNQRWMSVVCEAIHQSLSDSAVLGGVSEHVVEEFYRGRVRQVFCPCRCTGGRVCTPRDERDDCRVLGLNVLELCG